MDDPWGSPWASSESHHERLSTSPAKAELEPPPRAFLLSANLPRIPSSSAPLSGKSPWVDDDEGFGDWEAPDSSTNAQNGWAGWAGTDMRTSASPRRIPTPTSALKSDAFGVPSPIAWPGKITSPKQPASHYPFPSLDPSTSDNTVQCPPGASAPRLILEPPHEEANDCGAPTPLTQVDSPWNAFRIEKDGESIAGLVEAPKEEWAKRNPLPEHERQIGYTEGAEVLSAHQDETEVLRSIAHGGRSRQSSRSNHDSDFEEIERQDSPVRSVEEDSKARSHTIARSSGKVQELVDKFDGLAKEATQSQQHPFRQASQLAMAGGAEDNYNDPDDIGDSEGTEVGSHPANGARDLVSSTPLPDTLPPQTPTHVPAVTISVLPSSSVDSPISPGADPAPAIDTDLIISRFSPIQFEIDSANVDKLFSSIPSGYSSADFGGAADISDRIVTDSFTEISERKSWYRISRQGSSRKHDTGEDDNYRRVTWATSTMRLETMKIVRRWMEEDSVHGRPLLGGGQNRGNMFGWDSAAEPVSLSQVFRRRTEASNSQSSSTRNSLMVHRSPPQAAGHGRKGSRSLGSPSQARHKDEITSPVVSFGWSTAPAVNVSTPVSQFTVVSSDSLGFERPASSPQSTVAPKPTLQPTAHPAQAIEQNASIDDDDDGWGEMVSSTAVQTQNVSGRQSLGNISHQSLPSPPQPQHLPMTKPSLIAFSRDPLDMLNRSRPISPPADSCVNAEPSSLEKPNSTPLLCQAPIFNTSQAGRTPLDLQNHAPPTPSTMSSPMSAIVPVTAPSTNIMRPPNPSWASTKEEPLTSIIPVLTSSLGPVSANSETLLSIRASSEAQDIQMAGTVISALPDLSYMLR